MDPSNLDLTGNLDLSMAACTSPLWRAPLRWPRPLRGGEHFSGGLDFSAAARTSLVASSLGVGTSVDALDRGFWHPSGDHHHRMAQSALEHTTGSTGTTSIYKIKFLRPFVKILRFMTVDR